MKTAKATKVLSAKRAQWIVQAFKTQFPGKKYSDLSAEDEKAFIEGLRERDFFTKKEMEGFALAGLEAKLIDTIRKPPAQWTPRELELMGLLRDFCEERGEDFEATIERAVAEDSREKGSD